MDDKQLTRTILVNVFAALAMHSILGCEAVQHGAQDVAARAFGVGEAMFNEAEARGLVPEKL